MTVFRIETFRISASRAFVTLEGVAEGVLARGSDFDIVGVNTPLLHTLDKVHSVIPINFRIFTGSLCKDEGNKAFAIALGECQPRPARTPDEVALPCALPHLGSRRMFMLATAS